MSDTPETDTALAQYAHHHPNWLATEIIGSLAKRLERERNQWKANHDNQVELKRIISARPDLAERAPMVERLVCERDEARDQLYRIVNEGFGADDTITGETCAEYVLRRLGKSPANAELRDRPESATPPKQTNSPL